MAEYKLKLRIVEDGNEKEIEVEGKLQEWVENQFEYLRKLADVGE